MNNVKSLSIFSPPLDKQALTPGSKQIWGGLSGSSSALCIANCAKGYQGPILLLTENTQQAQRLKAELEFFYQDEAEAPPLYLEELPDWETLPYDSFSPHQDIISQRLKTLAALPRLEAGILIASVNTALHRLSPPAYVASCTLSFRLGQRLDLGQLSLELENAAYHRVNAVYEHGEYALRGSILDIFPMGTERPYRIELFDDEIESLRNFNPETQISEDKVASVELLPGKEYPFDQAGIEKFRRNFREAFAVDLRKCPIYEDVSQGIATAGIEYYLALFFDGLASLFDYLPDNTLVMSYGNIHDGGETFWRDINSRFEQYSVDPQRPLLPPDKVFVALDECFAALKQYPQIQLYSTEHSLLQAAEDSLLQAAEDSLLQNAEDSLLQNAEGSLLQNAEGSLLQDAEGSLLQDAEGSHQDAEGSLPYPVEGSSRQKMHLRLENKRFPDLTVQHKHDQPLQNLQHFISANHDQAILFCADSAGRRETLLELLKTIQLQPRVIENWQHFMQAPEGLAICVSPLEYGFWLSEPAIALITENQLFAHHVSQRRRRGKFQDDADFIVKSLTELREGAPVVHIDHGVGRYRGLQNFDVEGQQTEFLVLEYAGQVKLYVPVSSLHLINRYSGADSDAAPLHKLGSDQWLKERRKAAEKVVDVAAELLDIYARREAKQGLQFSIPEQDYQVFANAFPFEETEDQEQAIKAVIADMNSKQAMDRLICGDVGFGKTEVALRAAFIAVQNHVQVVILVPTTLLAQQHYDNFKDRFADWPFRLALLSRFVSKTAQSKSLEEIAEGKIDIVIGTHKLLQSKIKYKQLGLLIIDEEHRFGVRQKEKLKSLRADVDILTLTATPIPRTLNMAMSGMRDLSIIASPPARRLSIKTFVRQSSSPLIKEAIQRELLRGGQVFFLHNDVKSIEKAAEDIRQLAPEARVAVAHGQLRERELERVMSEFYHKHYNVLVCSTIIETGIDIPTANTIIIERSDKFGLAQLHQLRGRVGRSHHQAYAYMLTPPPKEMSRDALKRVEAIQAADTLGAGFTLASHDLEIRGAGELLGDEQSGHIQSIGFSLYSEMLEQTIKMMKAGKALNLDRPVQESTEINLRIPALIPDDYLVDVHLRLLMYKRIANAGADTELRELKVEMIDRFGLLPPQVNNLFAVTALKLQAESLGISKIEANIKIGKMQFKQETAIEPQMIVTLIQEQSDTFSLSGANELRFIHDTADPVKRMQFVQSLLQELGTT